MTEVTISWPDGALVGTELGDGPVALLLHAGGEHRGVWTNVAEGLVRGGYRTLAWDLRGHGESAAGNADKISRRRLNGWGRPAIESACGGSRFSKSHAPGAGATCGRRRSPCQSDPAVSRGAL